MLDLLTVVYSHCGVYQFNIWALTNLRITAAFQLCLGEKSTFCQPRLFILLVYKNEKVFELLNQKGGESHHLLCTPPASGDISVI